MGHHNPLGSNEPTLTKPICLYSAQLIRSSLAHGHTKKTQYLASRKKTDFTSRGPEVIGNVGALFVEAAHSTEDRSAHHEDGL